jgi:adenosylcobinamide-GDP ribazoletransferase
MTPTPNAARAAFALLTALPVRDPGEIDRRTAGRAMALAPFVGLALGVLVALVVVAFRLFTTIRGAPASTLLPAVVGIALLAILTRGLHLDGLADVADGLGAGGGRETMLAAMREPAVGSFGVIAVVLTVAVQVAALSLAIGLNRGTVSILVAAMAGRLAATLACTPGSRPARPDGLGALVAGSVRRFHAAAAFAAAVGVAALAGLFDVDGGDVGRAARAVAAVVVAVGAAHLVRRRLVTRLGGITGDVLGVLVEVAATVSLVVMVLSIPDEIQTAVDLRR